MTRLDPQAPELATPSESNEPPARRGEALSYGLAALGTAAALAGAVTVLWALLAPLLGLSFVVFVTGSMSPTIPQGALALVQRVDADELRVGQIAMLQRPGEQPISHRILAIDEDPADPGSRLVIMQGDDNPVPDADPYRVTTGAVVVASLKGGMELFAIVRSPLVMGTLTAVAAVLVLRAFWPSRGREGAISAR